MKYVLLFVDTENFAANLSAKSPEDRARVYAQVDQWMAANAAHIRGGAKLRGPETATTVRLDTGAPVVTDGPFIEGKEVVSGYLEIDVPDLDAALGMVKDWPGCPVVEIRPLES